MSGLTIRPLPGAGFGAEIAGFDPTNVTDGQSAAIEDASRRYHGLLCFSFGRLLESEELHALTAVFGESEYSPGIINGLGKQAEPGEEHLSVDEQVAAVRASGEDPFMLKFGNLNPATLEKEPTYPEFFEEWVWHTDMSYIEAPPTYSLLHAREVPDEGGDTGFCDQVRAARELPQSLRQRVTDLEIKHDATYASDGSLRPGMVPPASPIEASGYPHPVIRAIPDSGQEALFLGRRTNAYVMGMSLEESERLLDEIWAHATQPHFCYRHRWEVGQVVVFDNRRLMHMRHPMDERKRRFMWRTQTRGEAVRPASSEAIHHPTNDEVHFVSMRSG